jgi:hypothetical protein
MDSELPRIFPKTKQSPHGGAIYDIPEIMPAAAIDSFDGPEVLTLHKLPVPVLDELRQERDMHLRALADFDNYRRRVDRERASAAQKARVRPPRGTPHKRL